MQKTAKLSRKKTLVAHNLELLGYLTLKNTRKALSLYKEDYDFVVKYKDYKKDEKILSAIDVGKKEVKKTKIIKLM